MITKAERGELRTLIRQRFKVLRSDVEARRAELVAELERRIAAKFAAEDKAWEDSMYLIKEAVRDANRKANDILRGMDLDGYPSDCDYDLVMSRAVAQPTKKRVELRRQGGAQIESQVKVAYLQLDRQENELLTRLLVGALESEEARAFLGEIPTVSSLVPADRLLALVGPVEGHPDDLPRIL